MNTNKIQLSIIIVHYHVKQELFYCLESIFKSSSRTSFEVIIVDNDEKKTLKPELLKKIPKVRYVANTNKGYGQGNNVGAKHARGKYLFVLNPDTKMYSGCIDALYDYLEKNKNTAVVAPFLYKADDKIVPFQGAKILTPLSAIFAFSFIHKFFPNNPIARKYWQFDSWNGKSVKDVESVPGTAFMVRKEVFDQIGGFDENFFLYFEENDLSKRIKEKGWKLVMLPKAKIFHSLGESMKKSKKNVSAIFKQSRYYYLKKHFGLLPALLTEAILRTGKETFALVALFIAAFFLRVDMINETMPFIGDQGWFYLSARDLVLQGTIPLVGIESSHPWLHQGALWTYLLAGWFWLFSFDPVAPAYFTAIFDLAAIGLLYKLASAMFSRRTAFIAALLYATSPIVIMNSRIPYHTSPIPFLMIIYLFVVYKLINGGKYYFPLVIFVLALLYNFELVTFLVSVVTVVIVAYGIIKKQKWATNILNPKILWLSGLGFVVGMLPMLLYDISHGFPQTIKFLAWIGYRILVFFGYPPINPTSSISFGDVTHFFAGYYQKLLFLPNELIAVTLFIISSLFLTILLLKKRIKNLGFLFAVNFLLGGALFLSKMPSEAYLPVLMPTSILLTAVFFDRIAHLRFLQIFVLIFLSLIVLGNITFLVNNKYSFLAAPNAFPVRMAIAKQIVKESQGKEYNLTTQAQGKSLPNYSMNYIYLTWRLGNPPSEKNQKLFFVVKEEFQTIRLEKKERD